MQTRILFIIPPYFNVDDFFQAKSTLAVPAFTIPYGVLSLEAYVKSKAAKNITFDLLDLNLEAYRLAGAGGGKEAFKTALAELLVQRTGGKYDIVAISSLFNSSYFYLEDIIRSVKGHKNAPLCVMGGGLASNLYGRILEQFSGLDGICFGEGEIPLLDLVNADDYKALLRDHRSWVTRETAAAGKTPSASYVENLDEIPMFDYSLLKLDDYNSRSLDKTHCNEKGKRELTIHTSRGCPFNCVFCANSSLHGKRIRYMSEARVIAEVDNMIKNSGMNVLLVEDDHFMSNKKRAGRILAELNKRKIRVEFPNGIAVYAIDEEIGGLLRESGVTTVQLAVESCSDHVLKHVIDKPHTVAQVRKAARILRGNGILVHAFIVIGLPGETDEHREDSLRVIKEIGFDWVYFFIAAPIVGSRLYDQCLENGYLVEKDFKNHIVSKGSIRAPGIDPEKIEKAAYLMNLDVNFVNNFNVRSGCPGKARTYFEHIVKKYPKHALANYMLSVVCGLEKQAGEAGRYRDKYNELLWESEEWREFAALFKLPGAAS